MKLKLFILLKISPKNLLFFTLLLLTGISYQMEPMTQKDQQTLNLFVLDNECKPSAGLRKLLEAFALKQGNAQTIVNETQKAWLRTSGKERWEAEDLYENRKINLMPLFEEVGLILEIKPQGKEYDYLLIPGALHKRVQLRMEHAIKLWNEGYRFKEIIFLGSERILDPKQEPTSTFDFDANPIPKTESEMMQWVYSHTDLPKDMKRIKTTFINAPNSVDANGKAKRANTGDTIARWLATNPQPGTCLIVSNQPHIGYQTEVAKTYLPKSFTIISAGGAIEPNTKVSEILDALARWIYQSNKFLSNDKSDIT